MTLQEPGKRKILLTQFRKKPGIYSMLMAHQQSHVRDGKFGHGTFPLSGKHGKTCERKVTSLYEGHAHIG